LLLDLQQETEAGLARIMRSERTSPPDSRATEAVSVQSAISGQIEPFDVIIWKARVK
jgi:hypothetical protein